VWGAAVLLVLSSGFAKAEAGTLELEFAPKFDRTPLVFQQLGVTNVAGETLSFARVDFLLSGLALRRADGTWFQHPDWQVFLSLGEDRVRARVDGIPAGRFEALRFNVGVPANLNHSDAAKYPAEHPLNPNLNGLHWSWQGGYIFLALEGRWRAGSGDAVPGGFSLHFANDWNLTPVTVNVPLDLSRDAAVKLDFDLGMLLREISFAKDGTSTHSREDDPLVMKLARALPESFRAHSSRAGRPIAAKPSVATTKALYLPARFTPYRFVMSRFFPVPELPADNPLTEQRVALGRALFHESKLSRDNSLSCASCHHAGAAFSDSRRVSLGVAGRAGTRQAMPLFNLAWKREFFWDGRAPSLRAQALMPIQDHTEMDETLERVVAKLATSQRGEAPPEKSPAEVSLLTSAPADGPDYPELFAAAFGSPEITAEKLALALENFLLTLTSFDSKFDRTQRGEPGVELTEQEQRGFELFFTEYDPRRGQFGADCFHCHGGANFSNHRFANNGLDAAPADAGRRLATKREADNGRFAVPSLRNVAVTAPYMHDGRFATLEEAVAHYVSGVKPSATLDPNLAKHPDGGVPLSADDQAALVAFLKTLTEARYLPASSRAAANP
jgi:cytochrome c peroxidase